MGKPDNLSVVSDGGARGQSSLFSLQQATSETCSRRWHRCSGVATRRNVPGATAIRGLKPTATFMLPLRGSANRPAVTDRLRKIGLNHVRCEDYRFCRLTILLQSFCLALTTHSQHSAKVGSNENKHFYLPTPTLPKRSLSGRCRG